MRKKEKQTDKGTKTEVWKIERWKDRQTRTQRQKFGKRERQTDRQGHKDRSVEDIKTLKKGL
jgi:hypothetical protein